MITVLVIDDDPQVRAVATRMLELAGYAVLQADGGEQALGIVFDPAIRLDVVLTDVMMPGMLGSDVAKSIGRIRPEIPVLVMSGFADGAVIDSIDAPILPKPFTADELVRAVRKATGDGPPPEAPRTPAQR